MRAVEHEHGRARGLVFALMDVEVGVLDVQGQLEPLALDRAGEGCCYVEVQSVAKLVQLGSAAGLDAGRHVAGVVAAKT